MTTSLNIDAVRLIIIFVFPGLISMHIYRILMPARRIEWNTGLLEGFFYSGVNFAILLPLIIFIHLNNFFDNHPFWYSFLCLIILLIAPIVWPLLYRKIVRSRRIMKGLQLPYPTAWDYFFDQREEVFLLIHLNNGNLVGGFFGEGSYATSYPNEGEIYLKAVYKVNQDGTFGNPVEYTRGLLIRRDSYSYIEIFGVPSYR